MFERSSNQNAARGKFADEARNAYSDSFLSYSASVANTPIMLIDPENNHNGIVLFDVNVAEIGVGTPWFVIIAGSHQPQSMTDGDVILGANVSGATVASGTMDNEVYLEPNKGLYLYPLVAATSGMRQGLYRRL